MGENGSQHHKVMRIIVSQNVDTFSVTILVLQIFVNLFSQNCVHCPDSAQESLVRLRESYRMLGIELG